MKKKTYTKETLGTMVVFLLPSLKLKMRNKKRETLEDRIHDFLLKNFTGYTAASGNIFGYWCYRGRESYGEHKEYRVSFGEKEKIPLLEKFLVKIAKEMGEESIYLETGDQSWLLYP